jgi:hypothetical protein
MACGAIPESSPVLSVGDFFALPACERLTGFVDLSEKRYQVRADLARNYRFFVSGVLNSSRRIRGANRTPKRGYFAAFCYMLWIEGTVLQGIDKGADSLDHIVD